MKEAENNAEAMGGAHPPASDAGPAQPGGEPVAETPVTAEPADATGQPTPPDVAQADAAAQTRPDAAGQPAGPDSAVPAGAAESGAGSTPDAGAPSAADTTTGTAPAPSGPPLGPLPPSGPRHTGQFPAIGPQPGGYPQAAGMPPPPHGPLHTPAHGIPTPPGGMPPAPPGAPFGPAPGGRKRHWGKPIAVAAAAVVLALGAGTAGGVLGYSLAGDDTHASSPSQLVSDGATLSDVAKAVQPSVVSITTDQAGGSGVVYNADGYIVTNNHVASSSTTGKMEVAFADGTKAEASVVGTDPAGDLAVIKVDGVDNLTPISFGDSKGLEVGDTVLALGSPLGLDGSVSSGIVSALDRTIQASDGQGGSATTLNGLIQTDAAINPGNSGGALVNGNGELIGINTANQTAGGSEGSVGIGFAIPSDTVKSTADQLIDSGSVQHAFLGVNLTDAVGQSGQQGAIVTNVQSGSPAADSGLKEGDVITKIDGQEVAGAADVAGTVQSHKPGDKVEIEYTGDGGGDAQTVSVELGSSGGS